jgi:transcriptional regulator with XRE-family HTH domain
MSLAEVAELTGLHRVAIARAERTGKDVKASTIAAIAKALGVPVCELFEESGHERQRRKRKTKR